MIEVINKYRDDIGGGVPITRGTPLGNEYSHKPGTRAKYRVRTRDEAIACFARDLRAQLESGAHTDMTEEFYRLLDLAREGYLRLQCVCKPLNCHGDEIKKLLEEKLSQL